MRRASAMLMMRGLGDRFAVCRSFLQIQDETLLVRLVLARKGLSCSTGVWVFLRRGTYRVSPTSLELSPDRAFWFELVLSDDTQHGTASAGRSSFTTQPRFCKAGRCPLPW